VNMPDMSTEIAEIEKRNAVPGVAAYCSRLKIREKFFYSVATILFATSVAKLSASLGSSKFLQEHDALLQLNQSHILGLIGMLELSFSAFLILNQNNWLRTILVACMSVSFLAFHEMMILRGAPDSCNCLGNMGGVFSLSPQMTSAITFALLGYMLVGSHGFMLLDWLVSRKVADGRCSGAEPV
jgi:hypothetical protein